jgi:hypothetical protein
MSFRICIPRSGAMPAGVSGVSSPHEGKTARGNSGFPSRRFVRGFGANVSALFRSGGSRPASTVRLRRGRPECMTFGIIPAGERTACASLPAGEPNGVRRAHQELPKARDVTLRNHILRSSFHAIRSRRRHGPGVRRARPDPAGDRRNDAQDQGFSPATRARQCREQERLRPRLPPLPEINGRCFRRPGIRGPGHDLVTRSSPGRARILPPSTAASRRDLPPGRGFATRSSSVIA